jgi:hypothetical protein
MIDDKDREIAKLRTKLAEKEQELTEKEQEVEELKAGFRRVGQCPIRSASSLCGVSVSQPRPGTEVKVIDEGDKYPDKITYWANLGTTYTNAHLVPKSVLWNSDVVSRYKLTSDMAIDNLIRIPKCVEYMMDLGMLAFVPTNWLRGEYVLRVSSIISPLRVLIFELWDGKWANCGFAGAPEMLPVFGDLDNLHFLIKGLNHTCVLHTLRRAFEQTGESVFFELEAFSELDELSPATKGDIRACIESKGEGTINPDSVTGGQPAIGLLTYIDAIRAIGVCSASEERLYGKALAALTTKQYDCAKASKVFPTRVFLDPFQRFPTFDAPRKRVFDDLHPTIPSKKQRT